jgi:hypothetical protein
VPVTAELPVTAERILLVVIAADLDKDSNGAGFRRRRRGLTLCTAAVGEIVPRWQKFRSTALCGATTPDSDKSACRDQIGSRAEYPVW